MYNVHFRFQIQTILIILYCLIIAFIFQLKLFGTVAKHILHCIFIHRFLIPNSYCILKFTYTL